MATPPFKAVLFDLDNTLVDFLGMKRVASDAAARGMVTAGAHFPFSASEAGDILFGEYLEDIEGNDVFERFVRRHHQVQIGLSQNAVDRITAAAVNGYLRAKLLHTAPYQGVRQALVDLVRLGLRLGVVSDAPRFKAYQRLEAAGLLEFFDVVVTLSDHGERKPAERPFRAALEMLGLAPHEVLFVGDWPEKDMQGARAVGMATAWARYGRPGHGDPVVADHILDSVEGLIRIPGIARDHAT
ncbi:MAG: HAD family hydrolase [Thermoplasmatota archaeon]